MLFLSDHGDMLGERGLWFKMNFFEGSARVPLMIAAPGLAPGRVDTPVSTIDVTPTLCDLAGISMDDVLRLDGRRKPGAAGAGHGARGRRCRWNMPPKARSAPMVALREGAGNTSAARSTRTLLFDLGTDPDERDQPRRRSRGRAPMLADISEPWPTRAGTSPP